LYILLKEKSRMIRKRKILVFGLLILPISILTFSLFVGRYPTSFDLVIDVLLFKIFSIETDTTLIEQALVWDVRLSRALSGLIVGGALSVSGASLQSLFKNPLVDSGILGVSSGAGFGAILSIIIFNQVSLYTIIFAFFFGLLAVFLSTLISKVYKTNPMIMLVLGGVIVSSVFSSLISLGKYVADPFNELPAITFWLMGSLASSNYSDFRVALIPILIGITGMFLMRWRINVLSMGERDAKTLGINTGLNRALIIIFTTLATAGAVSIAGTIGWIGLVIPHLGRMLVGNDNRKLIPVSLSLGSFFLVFIDIISRTITGGEIPLGILTSLIGAPFYVYILKITKGSGW